MDNKYKIIISTGQYYTEKHLDETTEAFYIGNVDGCDIILDRDFSLDSFYIQVELNGQNRWQINCDNNVYISEEGIIKQITRELVHGDDLIIKYNRTQTEAFKLSFVIDFETERQDYRRVIEIDDGLEKVTVGGSESYNIFIDDELMEGSSFCFIQYDGGLYVDEIRCKYGLYVNGNVVKDAMEIVDYDFVSVLGYSFFYKDGELRTTGKGLITVNGLHCNIENPSTGNQQYPKFYRNTRVSKQINADKIHVFDPPSEVEKPKGGILKSLIPAIITLALTIVLRGIMGGGGTFIILSACTMTMGIITTIITFISDRRKYKRDKRDREEKYRKYIDKKREEIEEAREEESSEMEEIYYSQQEECNLVEEFSYKLFERKPEDKDFLSIRIGTGNVLAQRVIDYREQEQLDIKEGLTQLPEQLAKEYEYLREVPIVCDLKEANAVGVVGNAFHARDFVKNIILDLCTRHYHTDLRLIIITDEEKSEYIRWARYIPHLNNENTRNIVCDEESKNRVFEFMYKELSRREEDKSKLPYYVVLVLQDVGIKKHPISKYVSTAGTYGFSFVFFEEYEERLPMGCTRLIRLSDSRREGELIEVDNSSQSLKFTYHILGDQLVQKIAMKLAPVYTEEITLESSLVKNITLYELLGITSVGKLNLGERWGQSMTEKSLAAPLGVNSKKELVYLDLHEKHHGPHGLVAGTTGSGKSEILQSYILSMATLYHPHEVGFMIIDFKGGGMVNQFRDLPHLIGAITNIDGKEIDRSLKSIKAELKKRQRCFADADVNHIDAYISKFKKGEVTEIIPHLIVIVDEFAELKAEQPEFMKELISAARIGRSLGVHLILATQKPAGQVNEQIWSNSKFKLCLKVQNKADSNEVLKSPLAAEIKEPGRAYLQVGNNEIFELFQSAYSGAPADVSVISEKKEFYIAKVPLSGKREVIYRYKNKKQSGEVTTQLKEIVEYVNAYCTSMYIPKVPGICLPPLPESVPYIPNGADGYKVPIGIYDDPDSQYQGEAFVDLENNNLMIVGSTQNGKTNMLQLIIRHLAGHYSPEEFTFYVLDFASRVMVNFQNLNHCGGVVCAGEDEKLKNLFKLLNTQLELRKNKLLEVGVTSFASYREAGYRDIPLIVLFIDNLTALKELYLNENDSLINICREGPSMGVSVVVANSVSSGFGYKYLSSFAERVALYCNDQSEYGSLFEYCKERPSKYPGRCIIQKNKQKYECQTYISFDGEREMDRVDNMRRFVSIANQTYGYKKALQIPIIPKILTWDILKSYITTDVYMYPVGLEYKQVSPFYLNLKEVVSLGISGRDNSGRTIFLKNIIRYAGKHKGKFKVYVVDSIDRKLKSVCQQLSEVEYTFVPEKINDYIYQIKNELERRYEMIVSEMKIDLDEEPLLLLINKNQDALKVISDDKETMAFYKEITSKYKNLKVTIIQSHITNLPVQFNGLEVLKNIKENKKYLFFDDIAMVKLTEINPLLTRDFKKPIELGDAYYIREGSIEKIKTLFDLGNGFEESLS